MRPPPPAIGPGFVGAFVGLFLGLSLIKFGNPIIFEGNLPAPENGIEALFITWPLSWGYVMLGVVTLLCVALGKPDRKAWHVVLLLPLIWLAWQGICASQSVDARLTGLTLKHFAALTGCFYIGWFASRRFKLDENNGFWLGLLIAFSIIIGIGWEQKWGGLEATRQAYQTMDWSGMPPEVRAQLNSPEFRAKMASNRIFSTFVYPNALAGAVLLLFPMLLKATWRMTESRFRRDARIFIAIALSLASLCCLYWTGSKAGWLIALLMGGIALLKSPVPRRLKWAIAIVGIIWGLGGFAYRHAGYFEKGATSLGARMDYWSAAATIIKKHPLLGSGPGTFSVLYRQIKKPESEMARLAHNDYLEQASDSGIIGCLAYLSFVIGGLVLAAKRLEWHSALFPIWLGVFGWAVQGTMEFPLYIPALAWPAFFFLGWIWNWRVVAE